MRQLRVHLHTSLEERHDGELLVQRVRTLPQDERHSSSIGTLYQPEMQLKQVEAGGNGVCQLRHHDNHPVEEDQGERHRLQRLRSLLQGPWEGSTHSVEEGRCADKKKEVNEEGGSDEQHHAVINHVLVQLHQPCFLLLCLLQLLQLQLGGLPTMPVLQRQLFAIPTSHPADLLLNIL